MPADIPAVKERVQAYLTAQGMVSIDDKGRFSLAAGSTRVFIEVLAHPNDEVCVVMCSAPVLFEVPLTPELFKYVAVNADNWWFGHLFVSPNEDGTTGTVIARHTLLGDYLDKDELMYAVNGVLHSTDSLDDELQKQFGGKRYEDS